MSDTAAFQTPNWVRDAIFYQIFPERFANGNINNDPANVQPWGSPPTIHNFMGGDLEGVVKNFDHLLELGVNAIYFCPIFQATSNHKYNTYDYTRIDPHFGDMNIFKRLLDMAHQNGMKVILDAVFNHCGRGFYAFNDILENGQYSPYKDWFYVYGLPLNAFCDEHEPPNYAAWWNYRSLPKFNMQNQATRRYLLDIARYWIAEVGTDGWRLDVPNEVEHSFWQEFRQVVKTANPEAYIVGEIWGDGSPWLQGDQFDAIMNYMFRAACLAFFGGLGYDASLDHMSWEIRHDPLYSFENSGNQAGVFARRLAGILERYSPQVDYVQLNVLGTHDTPRLMTLFDNNIERVKLAYTCQMTYVGAPCIYYGDEIGMTGGGDPDCRRAFPWDKRLWNMDLYNHIRSLTSIRTNHAVLRRGDFHIAGVDDALGTVAYTRKLGNDLAVIVLNNSSETRQVPLALDDACLKVGQQFTDVLTSTIQPVVALAENHIGFNLTLPPCGAAILIGEAGC